PMLSVAILRGFYDIAIELILSEQFSVESLETSEIHPITLCSDLAIHKSEKLLEIKNLLMEKGSIDSAKVAQSFYAKILGHLWSIGGSFKYQNQTLNYNGFAPEAVLPFMTDATRRYLEEEILKKERERQYLKDLEEAGSAVKDQLLDLSQEERLRHNLQELPFHMYPPILNASIATLEEAGGDVSTWDVKALAKKIHEGKTVMLPYNWPGHQVCLVFTKLGEDYFFAVCNKGAGSFGKPPVMLYIMPKPSLKKLQSVITTLYLYRNEKTRAATFINFEMPDRLFSREFMANYFRKQTEGNCVWENLKLAFIVVLWSHMSEDILKKREQSSFFTLTEKAKQNYIRHSSELFSLARELYKNWLVFVRSYGLQKYLESNSEDERDKRLLYSLFKKAENKQGLLPSHFYLKSRVKELFDKHAVSIDNLYLQDQLEQAILNNLSATTFRLIAKQGVDPSALSSEEGMDLLALAVKHGRIEIFDAIMELSSSKLEHNLYNKQESLAHIAVKYRQYSMLEHLAEVLAV
ncbi:MAG: hypothetical protein L7U87_00800, partial [Chlamydiales bacterium]|nr:hypothetical protein [Chlamydiales bacterium]